MAETRQQKESRRERVIADAVAVADKIILDSSDGSEEETNFLTSGVAEAFIQKALHPFKAEMLKKDMDDEPTD